MDRPAHHLDSEAHDELWPPWVPYAGAAIVVVSLASALAQRVSAGHSMALPVAAAAIAAAPFLFEGAVVVAAQRHLPGRGNSLVSAVAADAVQKIAREPPVYYLWLFPLPVLVGVGLLLSRPVAMDFAPFVLVFTAAEIAARTEGRLPLAVTTTLVSAGLIIGMDAVGLFIDATIWIIAVIFGFFGGLLVGKLAERTRELESAQVRLAEKAATDERQRIAREVHDVIAHSMSVTMLHITAARMAMEREQSRQALEALREAEQQGRNSLADIRRTVGVLGADEDVTAPPMPSAADLPKLVADFRGAGLDVDLQMHGDIHALAPTAGLNLYRIVQESLTNVVKHAPGASARVEIDVTEDIRLQIHNGPGNGFRQAMQSGSGLGVSGMAGRAAMLGGSFRAEADGDGWTVGLVAPKPSA